MCIVWKGMCKQFYEQLVIINIAIRFTPKKKLTAGEDDIFSKLLPSQVQKIPNLAYQIYQTLQIY